MSKIASFIGGHEGFVSRWYLDPVGVPTIGFGFTWSSRVFREWWMLNRGRKMQRGDTISKADALMVLSKLIAEEYLPPVVKRFPTAADHVKAAGGSMVYNCGAGALKWKWAVNIAAGRLSEGCRLWRSTATTARGKRLPGLVRRRKEEADIAEFNRWPGWVSTGVSTDSAAPEARVETDDIRVAQGWLKSLGYYQGNPDGIVGGKTVDATMRFQKDHGTLKVDGIIGPATLSALQRAVDLKSKAGKTTGGGAVVAGGGVAEKTVDAAPTDLAWAGDALLWAGGGIIVLGLLYLAWCYRDELKAALKKV
jgi:lysozyme